MAEAAETAAVAATAARWGTAARPVAAVAVVGIYRLCLLVTETRART